MSSPAENNVEKMSRYKWAWICATWGVGLFLALSVVGAVSVVGHRVYIQYIVEVPIQLPPLWQAVVWQLPAIVLFAVVFVGLRKRYRIALFAAWFLIVASVWFGLQGIAGL